MIITARCPVCGSQGSMIHHDIRASLLYSCENCRHKWQTDPAEEPPKPEFGVPERPSPPSRPGSPARKQSG
jgi:hypothetical protein